MSKRKRTDAPVTDDEVDGAASAGADQWAKTVVDGASRSAATTEQPNATAEQPDSPADAASADGPRADADNPNGPNPAETGEDPAAPEVVDESWWVDEADETGSEGPLDESATAPSAEPGTTDPTIPADGETPAGDISVEDLVIDLERVTTERDQYLEASRRLQAEFENYKKQVLKREIEARERANDSLVGELLPVLDAFDGAVANGADDVAPMRMSFLDALAKQGLERIDPADVPFDPTMHEAVMHEESTDTDGPVVAEVMRAGYVWKGRVLRPAMVRTRG